MGFHLSLSNSKSPQVFRTLHRILADLNNAVLWMVSTLPLNYKSSSLFNNPLVTVPRPPITTGITVTFIFHGFFQFSSKVQVLISLFDFFQFYPMINRNGKIHYSAGYLFYRLSFGLVVCPGLDDLFLSQNSREFCVSHFSGRISGCAYTICSYDQISISCTIPRGSTSPSSRV